jgi:hypothetical protein
VGIITNAGGPGIMATDAIDHTSLVMPELTDATQERLAAGLPKTAALHNPVDVIGDALSDRYQHAIRVVLESDEVDSVLVILTPQVMTEVKKQQKSRPTFLINIPIKRFSACLLVGKAYMVVMLFFAEIGFQILDFRLGQRKHLTKCINILFGNHLKRNTQSHTRI